MSGLALEIAGLGIALLGAWAIPAVGMRLLVPSLESSSWVVSNYRGRRVFLGLGAVWAFWALGLALSSPIAHWLGGPEAGVSAAVPVVLVLFAFVFGMLDDVFGTHGDKGFRGHLRALAKGRLTTGGLKLLGIGFASLWAAVGLAATRSDASAWSSTDRAVAIVAGTVLIAGSANLLNLLDLRPGRALKGYVGLFGVSYAAGIVAADWGASPEVTAVSIVALAVWFVGPVVAVWRYDLAERGMLGDAGANAAGALAGLALMASLPLWGIAAAAVAVTTLNLVSERISFSRVIESNRLLTWIDAIGRAPSSESGLPER